MKPHDDIPGSYPISQEGNPNRDYVMVDVLFDFAGIMHPKRITNQYERVDATQTLNGNQRVRGFVAPM